MVCAKQIRSTSPRKLAKLATSATCGVIKLGGLRTDIAHCLSEHGLFICRAIALESLRHRARRRTQRCEAVAEADTAIKVK